MTRMTLMRTARRVMRTMTRTRSLTQLGGLVFLAALLLGGCTGELESQRGALDPAEELAAKQAVHTEPEAVELPSGSSARGVVVAALLLSSGDIERALLNGQVTPSEVKYATLALEEGTLNAWRELAETNSSW